MPLIHMPLIQSTVMPTSTTKCRDSHTNSKSHFDLEITSLAQSTRMDALKILCLIYNAIQFSKPIKFTQPVHYTSTLDKSLIFRSDTHSPNNHITKNSWISQSSTLYLISGMRLHQRYERSINQVLLSHCWPSNHKLSNSK